MSIELTIMDNGDLEIAVTNREELESIFQREYLDERAYLSDLLDSSGYLGNDWHCPYDIGLTEAPAIGQGAIYPEHEDENEEPADYENLWYFDEYMIRSYIEILLEEGVAIFTAHEDNKVKKKIK